MVNVKVVIYARNTGVQHNLIVGASIFDSSWKFKADMVWFVLFDAPANMTESISMTTELIDIPLSAGTYYVRARAWRNYDPGVINNSGAGWVAYEPGTGAAYDQYKGDGIYLDQMDKSFNVAVGQVSADITDLQITI